MDPQNKADQYIGRVNAGGWTEKPTAAPGEWLCEDIDSSFSESTGFYDVTYYFHRTRGTWRSTYQYRDKYGQVPHNIDDDPNSTAKFWAYTAADFGALHLTGPDQ